MLQQSQRLFFPLGVTFNPYNISVPGLAVIKSLVRVLLWLSEHPLDYVALVTKGPGAGAAGAALGLHCMNAGIGFAHLRRDVRSLVLMSGTLSPLRFVASELQQPFAVTLQADHVVDMAARVCAVSVACAPTHTRLRGTYAQCQTVQYQDGLGAAVAGVCAAVPEGVLCFLPSYALLCALRGRWQSTGLWKRLKALKHVFVEPQDAEQFEAVIGAYRGACRPSASAPCPAGGGAVLFAVFRGKVSEGIDFSDGMARAVVTVGIPFASVQVRAAWPLPSPRTCTTRGTKIYKNWVAGQGSL